MEEKKKRTITKVEKKVSEEAAESKVNMKKVETLSKTEEKSKATTLRIVAAILWVLAIGCELLAILCLLKALRLPGLSQMWWMIIFIVLDLILCVIAGFLWKKAAHLAPFKKNNNKVLFYILSQFAVIMAAVCFLPLIILVLTSKEDKLDKKSKTVVTIVAIVALLIAGLLGWDFHPISAEEKAAAEKAFNDEVCWTTYGHKYHLMFKSVDDEGNPVIDEETGEQQIEFCGALANSTDIYTGSVTAAIDSGCSSLCKFCASKAEKLGIDLTGINLEDGAEALITDGE
ncbi:MAG: hypothetical protein II872_01740 [Clostridia bacterium]|nr:hypothetical protein [Clostridia bacterium]